MLLPYATPTEAFFIDPNKAPTRFDLILLNNYRALDEYVQGTTWQRNLGKAYSVYERRKQPPASFTMRHKLAEMSKSASADSGLGTSREYAMGSLSPIAEVPTPISPVSDQLGHNAMNGRSASDSPPSKYNTVTLGRHKLNKQTTLGAPGNSVTSRVTPSDASTTAAIINGTHGSVDGSVKHGVRQHGGLLRRHSTFQPRSAEPECEMDELLQQCAREESLTVAFNRSKSWSRYCQLVLTFYNQRLRLEHDHAQKLAKLAETTRTALAAEVKNGGGMPLFGVFNELLDTTDNYVERAESTIKSLSDRAVKHLQQHHDEHENRRRGLKSEFAKQEKSLSQCTSDLKKARRLMEGMQSSYYRARDVTTRSQSAAGAAAINGGGLHNADHQRKLKEVEKKRRNEEDALQKKTESENQVRQLGTKRDFMQNRLLDLKSKTLTELCEDVIKSDRATQISTNQFLEGLTNLFLPYPSKYQELADGARRYRPGSEFMSFLQNLPGRSVSSTSLVRDGTTDDAIASTSTGSTISAATRASTGSSAASLARSRRNALNEVEHYDLIVETQSHRKPKRSIGGRLFDPGSGGNAEYTEPTKSHKLIRTRQVIKCVQCDRVSLLSETVKCTACNLSWHKKCLPSNSVVCGPNAKPFADSSRRVSIFGVSLKHHLELQKCRVPPILDTCIDNIQQRGMRVRGIYRTCGVKSKVEQICQTFEQSKDASEIKLDDVHPMNIASVIKLYLRKLPEPLLGFELYNELIEFDVNMDPITISDYLQDLILTKLPEQNYETLKFLMLHLKRVTWFASDNLMPASNLAAVIAPSLIWAPLAATTPSGNTGAGLTTPVSFVSDAHKQSKVIELIIKNAYDIFKTDPKCDWRDFFERYPETDAPEITEIDDVDGAGEVDIGEEEDDLEDDFEGDDDLEATTACSSSSVSQQPPTPDLLRNTATNNNNIDAGKNNVDDDPEFPPAGFSRRYLPAVRTVSAGNTRSQHYVSQRYEPPPSEEPGRFTKQRSFTTSILVSPQNNRKYFLPQQHSMDSRVEEYNARKASGGQTAVADGATVNRGPASPMTLRSGEVTIDMKHGQFVIPPNNIPDRPPIGPKSSAPVTSNQPGTPTSRGEQTLCVNGLGLIFSPSTDASYV
uniref:Rho-GAP domain-containing protein n=1 Tax=Panagrellus redivivus TaxID=6233 RepID=A0A7E4ZTP6_PANRE